MAEEILVGKKLEDGEKLLQGLRAKKFDLLAAFWMKIDGGLWHLYIATTNPRSDQMDLALATLNELGATSIEPSEVTLLGPGVPSVKEVLELQRQYPHVNPYSQQRLRKLGGSRLGEAHIYPPASAA